MNISINTQEVVKNVNEELVLLMTCCNEDVFKFNKQYNWDIYDFMDNVEF